MHISQLDELSRRMFMKRSGQLAALGGASSFALGLAGVSDASAFTSDNDYKALVCVFLLGGNDHANTLIPYDEANYARYSALRGDVALTRASLSGSILNQPNAQKLTDDIRFAIAPSMPHLRARFHAGEMACILNVGPLEAPLTKSQYESTNHIAFPRPPKLFSHNDQQAIWQSSKPEGAPSGWGGRIADLAQAANSNAMFTAISASGNGLFLRGASAIPYRIAPQGAPRFKALQYNNLYGSASASNALETLLKMSNGNVLATDYAQANARAIEYGTFMHDVLAETQIKTEFDHSSSIEAQLSVVAKLISERNRVGVKRQVFMVAMGGFDHHGGLKGGHEAKLKQLDAALEKFYNSTVELGVRESVTTFTASDFGRTLNTNGDGSEHGWGGHHFVIGGAVNGGKFFGTAPHMSVNTDDQVGRGRLLPSTSVDEYAATLARWFGVDETALDSVAPNLNRFATRDLGFMKSASAVGS